MAPVMVSAGNVEVDAGRRHQMSTPTTARNEMALIRKTQAGPASATTTPPSAGPTARPRLKVRAPRAMAWGNSARGTSSGWMACQAGSVRAQPTPSRKVSVSSESGVTDISQGEEGQQRAR